MTDTTQPDEKPEPAVAVTGRPADKPPANSTLASRAKEKPATKVVDDDDTENKAVSTAAKKAPSRRTAK